MYLSDRNGHLHDAASYFSTLAEITRNLQTSKADEIARFLLRVYERGRTVFLFGNGGSASLASHFACDLAKGTSVQGRERKRFRAIALTDNVPTMTAWANDAGYEDIFAEQLRNLIQPGDLAFAISCSGNSPNVLKALRVAKECGGGTIGIGGFRGGQMKALCDISLIVPSDNMQIIEDLHLSIAHCVFTLVKNGISGVDYKQSIAVGAS